MHTNNPFENFNGEILDTFLELPVQVSYDNNADIIDVYVGNTKITKELDDEQIADFRESWFDAYNLYQSEA